jgi:hypothetical protein
MSHRFVYTIPNDQLNVGQNPVPVLPAPLNPAVNRARPPNAPPNYFLLTQSVTIQNFGRERADWVEIVHTRKPDYFQVYPAVNYTESTSPTGEHTLRVESLAPKEFFTIQFLCYTHMPELGHIRSMAGPATPMLWMTVRKFPRWVYVLLQIVMLMGASFAVYWLIKAIMFLLKGAAKM